jgi:hypothetical protein
MFARKREMDAEASIIRAILAEMISSGIIADPSVLVTSAPPNAAPRNIPIPQMSSATFLFFSTPEPYAVPIEAAAPLAPILTAKKNAMVQVRIMSNTLDSPCSRLMQSAFFFYGICPST